MSRELLSERRHPALERAALAYAGRLGLSVLPLRAHAKEPDGRLAPGGIP
jgi:hypothetical protein